MVVSAFALFNFAFVFVSSFVSILGGDSTSFEQVQVPPCPEGTYPFWLDNCIMIIEKNNSDDNIVSALKNRENVENFCKKQYGVGVGYSWNLPELLFIGKQQALHQILVDGNFTRRNDGWHFWNRLTRTVLMKEWHWVVQEKVNVTVEEVDGFPSWVDETNETGYDFDLDAGQVCVISKETNERNYPWFEWIKAPCKLDMFSSDKSMRLQAMMNSSGIVVCEGTPSPSAIITVTTSTLEITASASSTEPTTASIVSTAVSSSSQKETTPTSIAQSISTSPTSPTSPSKPTNPEVSSSGIKTTTPTPSESTTSGSIETSPWAFVFMAVLFVTLLIVPILAFGIWRECSEVRKLESYLDHGSTATNAQMPTDSMIEDSTDDSYAQEMGRIPKPKPKPKGRKKKRHTK